MAVTTLIVVSLLIAVITPSMAGNNTLEPESAMCTCPGDVVTFTCRILGGGATVWNGSILNCAGGAVPVPLRHDSFQPETFSMCDGTIDIEIVGREGDCYISRLNFTANASFNNTSTVCLVQDSGRRIVGSAPISVVPVSDYLQGPGGFMVSSVNMEMLTFNWTAVNHFCPQSISYSVTSNCSMISCIAARGEATCSNLPIPGVCLFSIHSGICGQVRTGNDEITVTLKRPEQPQADVTPVYSAGSPSVLTKLMFVIYQEPLFTPADGVPSSVTTYTFFYSNMNSTQRACPEATCNNSIDAALSCSSSTDISVSLSASNTFGQGPTSDPTTIGCTNEFVSVLYDSIASTITCNFLDKMDTSIKSCSVMFGQHCGQILVRGPQQNSTMEDPNSVKLSIPGNFYCFEVKASSSNLTIIVQGRLSMDAGNNAGIAVGTIVGVVIIAAVATVLVVVAVAVIFVIIAKSRKRVTQRQKSEMDNKGGSGIQQPWEFIKFDSHMLQQAEKAVIKQFQLNEVSHEEFVGVDIHQECTLKKLTTELCKKKVFQGVDCTFYKSEEALTTLPDGKEIILLEMGSRKLFSLSVKNRPKSPNEIKSFEIFIRSDVTVLKPRAAVLYKVIKKDESSKSQTTP